MFCTKNKHFPAFFSLKILPKSICLIDNLVAAPTNKKCTQKGGKKMPVGAFLTSQDMSRMHAKMPHCSILLSIFIFAADLMVKLTFKFHLTVHI